MKGINFCVEEEPLPQPRPRFGRNGGIYFPETFQAYKEKVKLAAVQAMKNKPPMTGELLARLKFFRKYKRASRRFGDCDNLSKAVMDALNGIVYDDDSQIIKITTEKFTDKNNPRIEIEILSGEREN